MIRLLIILLFSCGISFAQELSFQNDALSTNLKLDLKKDLTFTLIDVEKSCEDFEFVKNTYQGTYVIDKANILTLAPKSVQTEKGKSIYVAKHKKRVDKIDSTTYLDYNLSTHPITLKYELLDFDSFKVLLKLDFSETYEFNYMNDYSEFYNLINRVKEASKEHNYIFKKLFLVTELDNVNISLENMRQSDVLKNRKEIFKKPFIAKIISVEERVEKNEHYYSGFDDRKFITYLDIEINAGTDDGVYTGMYLFYKNMVDCFTYNNSMIIRKAGTTTSTFTYTLTENEKCDLINYLIGKEVYFKGHLSK